MGPTELEIKGLIKDAEEGGGRNLPGNLAAVACGKKGSGTDGMLLGKA